MHLRYFSSLNNKYCSETINPEKNWLFFLIEFINKVQRARSSGKLFSKSKLTRDGLPGRPKQKIGSLELEDG